eukprot:2263036-Rhodomonas_salina.2
MKLSFGAVLHLARATPHPQQTTKVQQLESIREASEIRRRWEAREERGSVVVRQPEGIIPGRDTPSQIAGVEQRHGNPLACPCRQSPCHCEKEKPWSTEYGIRSTKQDLRLGSMVPGQGPGLNEGKLSSLRV